MEELKEIEQYHNNNFLCMLYKNRLIILIACVCVCLYSIQTPWRVFIVQDGLNYLFNLTQIYHRTKWTCELLCMYEKIWNLLSTLVFKACVAVHAVWQWWQQEVFLGVILSALHTWMLSPICPCRSPQTCQLGCERSVHSISKASFKLGYLRTLFVPKPF